MLLFHGSRNIFEEFAPNFIGSGEGSSGGIGFGFYFIDNLKGAAYHAKKRAKGKEPPVVYVCRLNDACLILDVNKRIADHNHEINKRWTSSKLKNYCNQGQRDWFSEMLDNLPIKEKNPKVREKEICRLLHNYGFQAICNIERGWSDGYLHGAPTLVLDANAIEIIEILLVEGIQSETIGDPKNYYLADSQNELGTTGVQSYLRELDTRIGEVICAGTFA